MISRRSDKISSRAKRSRKYTVVIRKARARWGRQAGVYCFSLNGGKRYDELSVRAAQSVDSLQIISIPQAREEFGGASQVGLAIGVGCGQMTAQRIMRQAFFIRHRQSLGGGQAFLPGLMSFLLFALGPIQFTLPQPGSGPPDG